MKNLMGGSIARGWATATVETTLSSYALSHKKTIKKKIKKKKKQKDNLQNGKK